MNKAFFLDRDGTIIVDKNYLAKPEDIELLDGVAEAIRMMNENNYKVIVVSNQSGVARGYFKIEDVHKVNAKLNELLEEKGAHIDAFYVCPHHPKGIISPYNIHVGSLEHICLKKLQKIIILICRLVQLLGIECGMFKI